MEVATTKNDWTRKNKASINVTDFVYGKVPPQATSLEYSVLGSIMLLPDNYDVVAEILKPECFYLDSNQRIFSACNRLAERSLKCDTVSVIEELKRTGELDIVGGPFAVNKLTDNNSINLEDHCLIIKQKFIGRELIKISGETIHSGYEDTADVFEVLDQHETKLVSLSTGFIKGAFQTSSSIAIKALERIAFLRNNRDQLSGVPTGFSSLDRITNGWQPTDLIILAARPSVGKTAFALNLAVNAASSRFKPTPVAFFSLEMGSGQLANRILSAMSGVNMEKISRGRMEDEDHKRIQLAASKFAEFPFFIDDTATLNIFELRSKARRLVTKHNVGLIVIDYLQLMSGVNPDKRTSNREQEISNISRGLKALAKQLNIPIIALSQLSRAIETRKDKPEPMLSDLRESGAIEQDADMVMFLYRPDYQLNADEIDPSISNQGMGKIAKHRNGGLDKIPFKTDLGVQLWTDIDFNGHGYQAPPSNFRRIESKGSEKSFDEGYDEAAPF